MWKCFQCKQEFEKMPPAVTLRNGPVCLACKERMVARRSAAVLIWNVLGIKSGNITEQERDWIRDIFIDNDGNFIRDLPESRGGILTMLLPLIEKEKEKNNYLGQLLEDSIIEQVPTVIRRRFKQIREKKPKLVKKIETEKRGAYAHEDPFHQIQMMEEKLDIVSKVLLSHIKNKPTEPTLPPSEVAVVEIEGKKPTKAFLHYKCTSLQKEVKAIQESLQYAREIHESSGRTYEASGKLLKVMAGRLVEAEKELKGIKDWF